MNRSGMLHVDGAVRVATYPGNAYETKIERTVKVAANIIIALTAGGCLVALALSIYPGVLNDLLFFAFMLSFILVPVVGSVALVWLIVVARKGMLRGLRIPWGRAAVVLALLFGTFVLLEFYVPRRAAFAMSGSGCDLCC